MHVPPDAAAAAAISEACVDSVAGHEVRSRGERGVLLLLLGCTGSHPVGSAKHTSDAAAATEGAASKTRRATSPAAGDLLGHVREEGGARPARGAERLMRG